MKIIKAYAIKNPCYKKATSMIPKGIVVHSTGVNNPNLWRYVDAPDEVGENKFHTTWNRSDQMTLVHAFIGKDKDGQVQVAQLLPYNYAAWGVGRGSKGSYNYNPNGHIQFEMCEDNLTDDKYFYSVISKAIEYCAYLCKTYHISVRNIVSHSEAHAIGYGSNHSDPDHWFKNFGYTMDLFRSAVMREMNKPQLVYTGILKKGSRGTEVRHLQESLNAIGYNCGAVDGIYGNKTMAAVRNLQIDYNLLVDGIYGKQTYGKIIELL